MAHVPEIIFKVPATRGAAMRKSRLVAVAVSALLAASGVAARESAAAPAPFEVGDSFAGNYLAALVAGADRDTAAASTFFRESLRADPRNPELIERAFVASLSNGDIDQGLDLARQLVTYDPKNGLAHLVLGIGQLKGNHWVAARREFLSGGAGREHDVTATLLTAWAYAGQGEEKKALAAIDGLKDGGFGVFRDYHAALIADLANDLPEATKRYKAAYAGDKTILRLVDAYARFEARHGATAEAERALTAFQDVLPHHPIIDATLADLKAGKPLQPLVKSAQEGAAEVLYGLGAAGGRQGDELAAMIYLRLSLYLAPQNSLSVVTLADIYGRLKQNQEAIDVYGQVPASSPLRDNADIQTGLTLDLLGKSDEAIAFLDKLVAQHPKDTEALTTLGNIQREQKRYADAIKTYTDAIATLPADDKRVWGLYYFRGIAYERDKQWPLAETDFKHALDLYPDQPLVLNYLGYSWVDRGEHLDEAFKMLRQAVALRPEDGYVVDSLGWAHYKLGDYEEAVKDLERALELKPADATINDHLGDAYWRIGRKLEAKFQWNHARDLNPDPEDLPNIVKKIENGLPDDKPPAATAAGGKTGG
jgi:tetratricopeptide (TPR) repeat protein